MALGLPRELSGKACEGTAYLGWPLIALCLLVLVLRWHNAWVRIPMLVALVMAVLTLGEELTIFGKRQGVWLPWKLLADFLVSSTL